MKKIVGVKFKSGGKVYYFDPGDIEVPETGSVIVETARGIEFANVNMIKEIDEQLFDKQLKPVIRVATEEDVKIYEGNKEREKEAFKICEEKIAI